jgi:hypothetical protein
MDERDCFRAVTGQVDIWWDQFFRWQLRGLTDDELLWQPVPDCWTLHDLGNGLVRYDFAWPPPQPSPFTTIGWRMCHVAVFTLANRIVAQFDESVASSADLWQQLVRWRSGPNGKYNFETVPFSLTAAGALTMLDECWAMWRRGLNELGEHGLWRPIGPEEHDFTDMQLGERDPLIGLVLHVHREVMHHGAEIGLLRNLYRLRRGLKTSRPR